MATDASGGPAKPGLDPAFFPVIAAFAADPAVTVKRMFGSENVLSVNGKIFAMLVKGSLVLKLPKERVATLVAGGACEHFDAGKGKPMKEWAVIPPGAAEWLPLAIEAKRFVGGP